MKRTPLKRSTRPINRVSKKRKRITQEIYGPLRDRLLQERPVCERCLFLVDCDEIGINDMRYSVDIHHKQGRVGDNMVDESKLVALCRMCHGEIHLNPARSRAEGWLISKLKGGPNDN